MPFSIRRPWWLTLFASLIMVLTIHCCVQCSADEKAFDDQKMEYYQTVEGGQQVWLNPGESYVPGSLRTVPTRSRYVYRERWRQPLFLPRNPAPRPYYEPIWPHCHDGRCPHCRPNNRNGAYYDTGPYGANPISSGVKMDGSLKSPTTWSDYRGALKPKDNPLNEKKENQHD